VGPQEVFDLGPRDPAECSRDLMGQNHQVVCVECKEGPEETGSPSGSSGGL